MNEAKHYIIIDTLDDILNKYYKYNVDGGLFTSDISKATLRTYDQSEDMLKIIYQNCALSRMRRKCVIKNIRKIKLQMLNNIFKEQYID